MAEGRGEAIWVDELIRVVARGIGMALSQMATTSSLEVETSAAISQMSQGMGDIFPTVKQDQRGYNRS